MTLFAISILAVCLGTSDARLEFAKGADVHDFGQVVTGAEAQHTFRMRAAGTEPLVIHKAQPT